MHHSRHSSTDHDQKPRQTMIKRAIITVAIITAAAGISAADRKDDAPRQAYIFGVGISMTDSTAFFTDIQTVDSLYLNKEGFVDHESEYSLQLKLYLSNRLNMHDKTCAVFYDSDAKDLQKEYDKVTSKLKSSGYKDFVTIGKDDFTFTLYRPSGE